MHKLNVAKAVVTLLLLATVAVFAPKLLLLAATDQTYDVAILNGRVMDPESGLDAIRNVGIRADGEVAEVVSPLEPLLPPIRFTRRRDESQNEV